MEMSKSIMMMMLSGLQSKPGRRYLIVSLDYDDFFLIGVLWQYFDGFSLELAGNIL